MNAYSMLSAQRFTSITIAFAALIGGHQPPARSLAAPEVEYAEPFTSVDGVRELRDGRVIVVDKRERSVLVLDLKAVKATKIGRMGSGPGEYQIPKNIFPLPGDSSMMFDVFSLAGPIVVTPQATMGGLLPVAGERARVRIAAVRNQVDVTGHIYSQVPLFRMVDGKETWVFDSVGVERLDRASGRRDTVAFVRSTIISPLLTPPSRRSAVEGRGATARMAGGPPPFYTLDQWAVAPDGRVAVITVEPYRVTFVDTKGSLTKGPSLPIDRVRVSDAHRDMWRTEHQRTVPSMVTTPQGSSYTRFVKPRYEEPQNWPDYLPAFLPGAVQFAPNGLLWVQRTTAADAAPAFDVIDGAGRVALRMTLPKHTRLVGFGTSSVYLVRIDDDDLEYLQRYALLGR